VRPAFPANRHLLQGDAGGIIMKSFFVATLIVGALIISGNLLAAFATGHNERIEKAVVTFDEPVRLQDVVLQGKYLFVHHEGMMERGKPCTSVYIVGGEKDGRFVVSFHCRTVKRDKAEQFNVITSQAFPCDTPVIQEIQFAGSTKGHQVR
jgi:predicted SnoaL-like aldol condensation-catalyzing enzyme